MKEKFLEVSRRPVKVGWVIGVVTASLILVIMLFFFGFRITYSPTLESSWDAISACAGWASAVASVAAVWAAIRIPKKIAERQDKIELFELKFKAYTAVAEMLGTVDFMAVGLINGYQMRKNGTLPFERMKSWQRAKEEEHLILRSKFLFCDEVGELIEKLLAKRAELSRVEAIVEEGAKKFPSLDDLDVFYDFMEAEALWGYTSVEREQIKALTQRNLFLHTEFDENGSSKEVVYDLYELCQTEEIIMKEAQKLHKELLQAMEKELRIYQDK